MADIKIDSSGKLITVEHVFKSFPVRDGEVQILKDLNFEINKGEFVVIFGPSGCGKSTLLHCLLGLEQVSKGRINVENKDYLTLNEDERAVYRRNRVGMIYQQALWISALTVRENVEFPLHLLDLPQDEVKKRVDSALNLVVMQNWSDYQPTELSSGQQQKISLARALALDSVLIVADEPTGNLDTVSGQELINIFSKLTTENKKTIIMVTHDLEYLNYADKIIHMIDGEVVEIYCPKQKSKEDRLKINGKKELGGLVTSNVRDRDFLKKLKI